MEPGQGHMQELRKAIRPAPWRGGSGDFLNTPLQSIVREVEAGHIIPTIGRVFQFDDIVEAHRCMEDNAAGGKIVILT